MKKAERLRKQWENKGNPLCDHPVLDKEYIEGLILVTVYVLPVVNALRLRNWSKNLKLIVGAQSQNDTLPGVV